MNLKGSTGKDRIAAEYAKIYVECCDQPQALKRTFDSSGFSAKGTLLSASAAGAKVIPKVASYAWI